MLCGRACCLPALVSTFEKHYEQGDAEAHRIAVLLTKYNTVARIYMLSVCDIQHTVAILQARVKVKDIDLASVLEMTESTTKRLMELKENVNTSTWFKNHFSVFNLEQRILWSQRNKITCFFTRAQGLSSLLGKCC